MRAETLDFACHEIAGYDSLGLTVYEDYVKHLMARIRFHRAGRNLTVEGGIGSEEKLLSGLAACVEGAAHLSPAERAVCEKSAVFPRERNTLRDTLVDDVVADLRKTIDVCLTATVVTAFDCIVEQTVDGVVVVLIVLCGIDTSLRCDGVCTAG